MLSAFKVAVQGMTLQQQKQDQISNNLANVNTTGFKGSSLVVNSFDDYLKDSKGRVSANRNIRADQVAIDFSEGTLDETGNDLDLAIKGSGFFTVLGGDGVRYTRDGSFALDQDGFLITQQGERVFGRDGFIHVEHDKGKVTVFDNGDVVQDGQKIDTLKISDFNKPYKLLRVGNNSFRPKLPNNPAIESDGFVIKQRYLETSNIDAVTSMVDMITANRTYNSIAKAMQSEDNTLDKAVNSVGKI